MTDDRGQAIFFSPTSVLCLLTSVLYIYFQVILGGLRSGMRKYFALGYPSITG